MAPFHLVCKKGGSLRSRPFFLKWLISLATEGNPGKKHRRSLWCPGTRMIPEWLRVLRVLRGSGFSEVLRDSVPSVANRRAHCRMQRSLQNAGTETSRNESAGFDKTLHCNDLTVPREFGPGVAFLQARRLPPEATQTNSLRSTNGKHQKEGIHADRTSDRRCHHRHPGRDRDSEVLEHEGKGVPCGDEG